MRQSHVTEIPHGLYIQRKQCCDKTLYSSWFEIMKTSRESC